MPQDYLLLALHSLLIWGSVIAALVAGLLLPISNFITVPLGTAIWLFGFLYNLNLVQSGRPQRGSWRRARGGNDRIAARTAMNFGIAFAFRSWPTLIAAFLLIPVYAWFAGRHREYLDGQHGRRMGGVFPDRRRRRPGLH
jgi:hypothetical protein